MQTDLSRFQKLILGLHLIEVALNELRSQFARSKKAKF